MDKPEVEGQTSIFSILYQEDPETEWPVPHQINPEDEKFYPNRLLIDRVCTRCGQGFASIKPNPKFCSKECHIHVLSSSALVRTSVLWNDTSFRSKILAARQAAGYPDTNRPEAVARRAMRRAVKNAVHRCLKLRGELKGESVISTVGYSARDLCDHIELLFRPGMNWGNYGDWEVDHKHPISKFPLSADIKDINALENLQPLWKDDNRRKHASVSI